jgi:hypothetical protein
MLLSKLFFSFFHFLKLLLTTEAMGIWRSADEFPVVKRQKEMRAQRLLNARQPANEHRRVLGSRSFFLIVVMLLNECHPKTNIAG